jgi:hypothetical protein
MKVISVLRIIRLFNTCTAVADAARLAITGAPGAPDEGGKLFMHNESKAEALSRHQTARHGASAERGEGGTLNANRTLPQRCSPDVQSQQT